MKTEAESHKMDCITEACAFFVLKDNLVVCNAKLFVLFEITSFRSFNIVALAPYISSQHF